MDPKNPATWKHFDEHPSIKEYGLADVLQECYREQFGDPNADPDSDLDALKAAAGRLVQTFPGLSIELVVLDDLTNCVKFDLGQLEGEFGLGCNDETYYCHVDADPSDMQAPEEEVDNLTTDDLLKLVTAFASR